MNANELMLNNWVYNSKGQLCKVHSISNIFESNIYLDNYDKENDGCFELEIEVNPIPTSSEILEKNGFRKEVDVVSNTEEYYLDGFPFVIVHERYDDEWYGGTYMVGRESDWVAKQFDCTYVNQLQNAINLCQLNKQIEL